MNNHQLDKEELRNIKHDRKDFKNIKRKELYIILDDLKVHHNIGTIIRLADAVLAKKVYLCGKTKTLPNQKIKSSSRGSEKWVDIEYHENIVELINELKENDIQIVSLEITNNSIPYYDFIPSKKVALVLGREYDGVNKEVISLSNSCIHLPISGMCNSINVSCACSVAMYHIINYL